MSMNLRQQRLQNMIACGNVPVVQDSTVILDEVESAIPFHWGDIEALGWGFTVRHELRTHANRIPKVTRHYTGPGTILLSPTNVRLASGEQHTHYA